MTTSQKTFTKQILPWGLYNRTGHRLLCSDGEIRAAELAPTANTFFSVPASIRINGKRISGYMTAEEQRWIQGEKEREPFLTCYSFRHHTEQKNPHNLPAWGELSDSAYNQLIESAQ